MPIPSREEAAKILQQVPNERAFYFYSAVGAPVGVFVRSLDELVAKLESMDPRVVEFHVGRGDFGKWIAMLGDDALSRDLSDLRLESLPPEELRRRIIRILSSRVYTLKRAMSGSEETRRKISAGMR